jgi:hypothetical protein
MENLNNTPEQAVPVSGTETPVPVPAAPATPAQAPAVPVQGTDTPKASPSTAAPEAGVKGELPKTTGNTVGGWNRFAGYSRQDAMNKKNERRDGKGRR